MSRDISARSERDDSARECGVARLVNELFQAGRSDLAVRWICRSTVLPIAWDASPTSSSATDDGELGGQVDAGALGLGALGLTARIDAQGVELYVPGLPSDWAIGGLERHSFEPEQFEPFEVRLSHAIRPSWNNSEQQPDRLAASPADEVLSFHRWKPEDLRPPREWERSDPFVARLTRLSDDELRLEVYSSRPVVGIVEYDTPDQEHQSVKKHLLGLFVVDPVENAPGEVRAHFGEVTLYSTRLAIPAVGVERVKIRAAKTQDLGDTLLTERDRQMLTALVTRVEPKPRLPRGAQAGATVVRLRDFKHLRVYPVPAGRGQTRQPSQSLSESGVDNSAFAEYVTAQTGRWLRLARRWLGNAHDAEDAVQELVVELQVALTLNQVDGLDGWCYEPLHRICLKKRERERPPQGIVVQSYNATPVLFDGLTAKDSRLSEDQLWRELAPYLARLTPAELRTLLLVYVAGMSYEQIRELDGTPVGTSKPRANRAKEKMRAAAAELSIDPAQREI